MCWWKVEPEFTNSLHDRYQYLVIYHTRYKKNDAQMKMVRAMVEEDEAVEEERKRRGDKLLELINKITDFVLAIQIGSCARYLAENRTQIEFTSQGSFQLTFI